MDRILIPNGGMPFTGDDLLWIQNGLRAGMFGFGRHFGAGQSVVISGVNVTISGTDIVYTEGYVIIDDEILYVPAGTAVDAAPEPDKLSIELDVTYDAAGTDVFADLVSRDTYEKRRAKVVFYSSGTPPVNAITFDIIDRRRHSQVFTVTSFVNGWSGSGVKVRRFGKVVAFQGTVADGDTNTVAFNVPLGFRPEVSRRLPGYHANITGTDRVQVRIDTNGNVTITKDATEPIVDGILLDSVTYLID